MSTDQLPNDWDPKPEDRRWVRSSGSGDLGFVVRRGGLEVVKLDRPMQEILRKLDSSWEPASTHRPLADAHCGRVSFEADKALAAALGDHSVARKEWAGLSDAEKQKWAKVGPTGSAPRKRLREAIFAALKPYTRESGSR